MSKAFDKEYQKALAIAAGESPTPPKKCSSKFFDHYVETALWSSTDNSNDSGGDPLDDNYSSSDVTKDALKKMRKDCDNFVNLAYGLMAATGGDDGQHGHDFWLTRNGHGAGFWDRGYKDRMGDELSEIAKSFGSQDLYVSRGKIGVG